MLRVPNDTAMHSSRRKELNAVMLHSLIHHRGIPDMVEIKAAAAYDRNDPTACIRYDCVPELAKQLNMKREAEEPICQILVFPRSVCEFLSDYVQLVAGVCLHTAKKCLFLKLTHDSPITTNYSKVMNSDLPRRAYRNHREYAQSEARRVHHLGTAGRQSGAS